MNWRRIFLNVRAAVRGSRCCVFCIAAPALLLCAFTGTALAQQPTIRFVRNPDPAPALKLSTLDGKPLSLADYKSKVILLNFWATWCGPCRSEIPDLVELQNKYKDQLQIIGLVVDDDDEDAVKKFAEKFGINYPIAMAPDEVRAEYGGIPALPTSFVLDGEGRVVQKHEGLRDPVLYEVEIRSLLGMPIGNVKVESFEDTGQIFLKHADRATQLPGVDLSKLTPEQRAAALHKFNAEACSCGCQYTLAQCRIWDRNCNVSKEAITKIIEALAGKPHQGADASAPAKTKPADPEKSNAPATPSPPKPPATEKSSTAVPSPSRLSAPEKSSAPPSSSSAEKPASRAFAFGCGLATSLAFPRALLIPFLPVDAHARENSLCSWCASFSYRVRFPSRRALSGDFVRTQLHASVHQ